MPSQPNLGTVEVVDAVEALLTAGMPEAEIAKVLKIPARNIKAISERRTVEFLEPEDREIADALRGITWEAIRYTNETMQWGSPAEKHSLSKIILARTMGMVGAETTSRYDLLREEWDEMMAGISGSGDHSEGGEDFDSLQAIMPGSDVSKT